MKVVSADLVFQTEAYKQQIGKSVKEITSSSEVDVGTAQDNVAKSQSPKDETAPCTYEFPSKGQINFHMGNSKEVNFLVGSSVDLVQKSRFWTICSKSHPNTGSQAETLCAGLFSGPRPTVGWWELKEQKAHDDAAHPRSSRPKALISVTGWANGNLFEDNKPESEERCKRVVRSVLDVAKAWKAMIVDGGSSDGVMGEIGKAVSEDGNRVALLGIFPVMAIKGRDAIPRNALYLVEEEIPKGQSSDMSRIKERGQTQQESKGESSSQEAYLDRNHLYFALIHDTGTSQGNCTEKKDEFYQVTEQSWWGTEIMFRRHIEEALNKGTPIHISCLFSMEVVTRSRQHIRCRKLRHFPLCLSNQLDEQQISL